MKKRNTVKSIIAVMLCAVLSLAVFSACTKTAEGPTRVSIYFLGASVSQDADVIAAANARLDQLGLNITINPVWGDWGAGERMQNVLDTADTSVDIVFTCSWANNYVPNALRGNLARLDDPSNNLLEKYGKDVKAAVPQFLWDGFKVNAGNGPGIYAVPGYKDYAQLYTWDINNTRLAELGFDINSFKWDGSVIFDPRFEEALAAAKQKYGTSFYPLMPEKDNFIRMMTNNDGDMTGLTLIGFPFNPQNPALPRDISVGLIYEDSEIMRVLDKLHEFFQKGYIDPRVALRDDAGPGGAIEAGFYLFNVRVYAHGFEAVASNERGIDARFIPISKPIVSTMPVQGSGFGISVYSKNQAAAMQFINAWYTDRELATIMCYGVEGTHYKKNYNGTITINTDTRAFFQTWRNGMGNIFILPPQDVEGPAYFDEFRAYNDAGIGTNFLGFTFDPANVQNEMAALRNVRDEYISSISTGNVNPRTAVPVFIDRLNANGMKRVLDEINSQLRVFYAGRR